jgi:hypothetical protein
MKYPPKGELMEPRHDLDKADRETLRNLAKEGRCQARLLTDRGFHYIYCGGYFHGKAHKTKGGLRCRYHGGLARPRLQTTPKPNKR